MNKNIIKKTKLFKIRVSEKEINIHVISVLILGLICIIIPQIELTLIFICIFYERHNLNKHLLIVKDKCNFI